MPITLPLLHHRDPIHTASSCGKVRPSKSSRWRALSLVLIHVAFVGHLLHWHVNGRTLTPLEPSETMQTLGSSALLNAGCIFFSLTILSTLIFGRFFCGWGCHIVALQDLCTWILRRMGMSPKPFRSRLLVFMPLTAALFMFVLPTIVRLSLAQKRAALTPHFTTQTFWATFPTWPVAMLTFLVCGFLIVYLLGNKGFCTYACPYGGIFGLADRIAPGKIRVTEACDGCAHCTATCTSNVRVHEEVRDFGMVVNPGCMKCMDCISVCPKDALYFGFGMPTVGHRHPTAPRKTQRQFDYTWPEEIGLLILFLGSAVIFRKLYDAVPLLLALGLAAISAFILLSFTRLLRGKNLVVGRMVLRNARGLTHAGVQFSAISVLWLFFLFHSGLVQFFTINGSIELEAAQAECQKTGVMSSETTLRFEHSRDQLHRACRFGLIAPPELLAKLASVNLILKDNVAAEAFYERAIKGSPAFLEGRYELARLAKLRGDREKAIAELRNVIREQPDFEGAHGELAELLIQSGRANEALDMLRDLVQRHPQRPEFQCTYGLVQVQRGDPDGGLSTTRSVIAGWPEHADAHYNLGFMLANRGELEEALKSFRRAAELRPDADAASFMCAKTAVRLGRLEEAFGYANHARSIKPFNKEYLSLLAELAKHTGRLTNEIAEAESAGAFDRPARFRLLYLYHAAGLAEKERELIGEFDADSVLEPGILPAFSTMPSKTKSEFP